MKLGIATDHGRFVLKEELIAKLRAAGHEVTDFGAHTLPGDDYPDFVAPFAKLTLLFRARSRARRYLRQRRWSIRMCHKVKGVRADLIHDHFSAKQVSRTIT